jgi:hypothetical protein
MKVTEKELAIIRAFGTTEYEGLNPFGTWMWSIQEHSELSKASFPGVVGSLVQKELVTTETEGDKSMIGVKLSDTWSMALTEKGVQVYFDHFAKECSEFFGMTIEALRKHLSEEFKTEIISKQNYNKTFNILTKKTMTNLNEMTVAQLRIEAKNAGIKNLKKYNKAALIEMLSVEAPKEEKKLTKAELRAREDKAMEIILNHQLRLEDEIIRVEGTQFDPAEIKASFQAKMEAKLKSEGLEEFLSLHQANLIPTPPKPKKTAKEAKAEVKANTTSTKKDKPAAKAKKARTLSVAKFADQVMAKGGTFEAMGHEVNEYAEKTGQKQRYNQAQFKQHIRYRKVVQKQSDYLAGAEITDEGITIKK